MGGTLAADISRVLATRDLWRTRSLERASLFTAERAATDYAAVLTEAVAAAPAPRGRTRRIWSLLGY
jgi:hypothetical protein